MHYYKFNISDWALHTAHLSLVEEAIYFRLINFYYDSEKPIPVDLTSTVRKLRMRDSLQEVCDIINEFFCETENGFTHKRCDELLKEYRKTNKKNKLNGAKGGRPSKTKDSEITQVKPTGLIKETHVKPKDNPNYELLTKNQELITINQSNSEQSNKSDTRAKEIFEFWCETMNKKRSAFSPKRKKVIEARLKDGYPIDEIKTAITNCSNTPHNMGRNENNKEYNDIELICRSSEKLEQFRDNAGVTNEPYQQSNQSYADRVHEQAESALKAMEQGDPRDDAGDFLDVF